MDLHRQHLSQREKRNALCHLAHEARRLLDEQSRRPLPEELMIRALCAQHKAHFPS